MMVDEAHRLKNDESALYKVRTQARAHMGAAATLGVLWRVWAMSCWLVAQRSLPCPPCNTDRRS